MQTFSFQFAFQVGFFILYSMRIWFFGTPSLSASVLEDLLNASDIEVVFVVTNPDRAIGRSSVSQASPVKKLAIVHNIPVFTPIKIRDNQEFFEAIASYNCDYFIVVAYGRILPKIILKIPQKMCINIHGSILPAYRWASPIQAALLWGEKETGVTIMEMSEGMDEWDILKIHSIAIDPTETTGSLFEKFSDISGTILIQSLRELEMGWITPLPQDSTQATYCKKIEKEDGLIDWNESTENIYHKWQAYTPWPWIYTIYNGKRLLLEKVSLSGHCDEENDPQKQQEIYNIDWIASQARNDEKALGKVIKMENGNIGITCAQWILTLEQVKLEWKKSQSIKDFVNGNQKFIWISL